MADRLDTALSKLAAEVVFPPTPDLASSVRWRPAESGTPGSRRLPWARSFALAVGLSLLIVAAAVALAWVLPGLRIVPVASLPPASTVELGEDLRLGEPIVAADAPFALDALGAPTSAYDVRDGTVASLVYAPGDDLPDIDGSGIGLLVQRIEGDLDRAMVEKLVEEVGAVVTPVNVGGADGFWIEGPPHQVRYLTPSGFVRAEMTRLVGDTLVWQRDGVLYRMESGLGRAGSLRLAATVRDR